MMRGEGQIGWIPISIAPVLDIESATCELAAFPKAASISASGRGHGEQTRKPTLFDMFGTGISS
jgi:hypothetical protein